ncbi:hypothetical protein HOD08_03445 [bacterium]|nr:hypothetical protein [bacterium]
MLSILLALFPISAIIATQVVVHARDKQKNKTHAKKIAVGDSVITRGGLIGTVVTQRQKSFVVQMFDGSMMEVLSGALKHHETEI